MAVIPALLVVDPTLFAQLDIEMREVRRKLEERRHLSNLQKEAVNDIRRYRRRANLAGRAAAAPEPITTLSQGVDEQVIAGIMGARDTLRQAVADGVSLESRWSELVLERERRLTPLPRPLVERLGEVEERRGVLAAQMKVAERVQMAGAAADDALTRLDALLADPDTEAARTEAIAAAQLSLLSFRREVKHLHREAGRIDAELATLLAFSDDLLTALFSGDKETPKTAATRVRATQGLVRSLTDEAERLLHVRRRNIDHLVAEQEPLAAPS